MPPREHTPEPGGGPLDVVVVGSIHQDLVVDVPRLPGPGETVLGTGHFRSPGGKGANQAVAARRLGATVAMVGQVGDDADGTSLRRGLAAEGIDVGGVVVHPQLASGLAVVAVDPAGENAIVVSPGASGALDPPTVEACAARLSTARVLLLQLEVAVEAVDAAVRLAGGTVVLNPAPARALADGLLDEVDVLVPNRVELAHVAGVPGPLGRLEDVTAVARGLADRCAVVVTLGADGALVVRDGETRHVPAPRVATVDTTGAGDAFCGALAVRLAAGDELFAAVPWAVHAAALSTTVPGAQPSLPTLEAVTAATAG